MINRNGKTNDAYGMLCFSRVHGGDQNLFGSSVKHNEKIRLRLKTGEVRRTLSENWYLGGETLYEVEMSYSQFAELISAMNIGGGVPVTIRYTKENGPTEPIVLEDERRAILKDFQTLQDDEKETAQKVRKRVEEIFSEKRNLKVSEKEEILTLLNQLEMSIASNRAFTLEQFNKKMEDITTEAKGEVEAFVENKMHSLALAALAEKNIDTELENNVPILIEDSTSGVES